MYDINDKRFKAFLKHILEFEGGFVDDPVDRGGRTNFGITQKTYDEFKRDNEEEPSDVKNITPGEVAEIYFIYYNESKANLIENPTLAYAVYDTAVNAGVRRSHTTLQRAINANTDKKITEDGVVGKVTLEKLATMDQQKIAESFIVERCGFYNRIVEKNPSQKKFIKGWLRRAGYKYES